MKKARKKSKIQVASLVIPAAFVIAELIFAFVFGSGDNFIGGNHDNMPIVGNFMGTIYKGGFIVPILMTLLLTVITFCIERFVAIRRAKGKNQAGQLIADVKEKLNTHKVAEAIVLCDNHKGSLANVIKSGLLKYQEVEKDDTLSKEQKTLAIQKDVEESTSLELPSLEQNLVILATISSVSTLMGLLGTVLGMIRSFAAMSSAGAPDSTKLATGISEALINTAFGIGTAALAVIMYNFFTSSIDKITYSIDEAGYSIVQSFGATHK